MSQLRRPVLAKTALPVLPAALAPAAGRLVLGEAERFIRMFYAERAPGPPDDRLAEIRAEIRATGTYRHTPDELTFAAQVAWRNSSRCIGRLYWQSLQLRDRRHLSAPADIAAESATHLREATNRGRIRPMITVFAPDAPGRPGPRILSPALISYAGHETGNGVIGDPQHVPVTRLARRLGWQGARSPGRFDPLPLIIRDTEGRLSCQQLPPGHILQVSLAHPAYDWFGYLGLKWHAVPVISDMYLDAGGIRYPAAPFNGWYMCTEIGSRDLGDVARYNQLPVIARKMGLSTTSDRTLWKDKAMTELNIAVMHSFTAAGVTITDHHTEAGRFLQHVARENRHNRACPANWSWIVPPAASSATPVFHRSYSDFDQTPNFYRHPPPCR